MKKFLCMVISLYILIFQNFGIMAFGATQNKYGKAIFSDSFEDGLTVNEWEYHGKKEKVSIVASNAHSGDNCVYIKDENEDGLTTGGIVTPYLTADAGRVYTFSVYIKADKSNIRLYVKWFDKEKKALSNKSFRPDKLNEWNEVKVSLAAPENTAYVQITISGSLSGLGNAYVDDVNIYESLFSVPFQAEKSVDSKIVEPNGKKLSYTSYDDKGNTLSDFSYAGFKAGQYELPDTNNLKVAATLSPSGTEDDTSLIQKAINDAVKYITCDEMVVIKLKAGQYNIGSPGIKLKTGVILSGEGQGPTGTVLYAKDAKQYTVVSLAGSEPTTVSGTASMITSLYLKSGGSTFDLSSEDIKKYAVGDTIRLYHEATAEWDKYLELETMIYDDPKDGNTYDTSWAGHFTVSTERVIKEITGNTVTVDFPFFIPYDTSVTPITVYKLNDSKKIKNSGVENLRILSYFDKTVIKSGNYTDDNHATYGVQFKAAKDCFAQNVTVKHIKFSAFYCHQYSKQITIRNCSSIEPISTIAGSERYIYGCTHNTQQILITGCYSHNGRHDFETSYTATGPYAFVDNLVDDGITASETHGTWSTGVLYDNLLHIGNGTRGFIASANRGVYGSRTSQGWSGAGVVIWNSLASSIISNDVNGDYQNFLVGVYGVYNDKQSKSKKSSNIDSYKRLYKTDSIPTGTDIQYATQEGTSLVGDCYKESEFASVNPGSIYKAQLAERFTGDFNNLKPNAPTIVYPKYDSEISLNTVNISGFARTNASEVNVYIDNEKYLAEICDGGMFTIDAELSDGVHKIYATQTIDGVEGNKTPDRFVIVNKADEKYPEHLKSSYSFRTLSSIVNDTRIPFGTKIEVKDITSQISSDSIKLEIEFSNKIPDYGDFTITTFLYIGENKQMAGFKNETPEKDSGSVTITMEKPEDITGVKVFIWEDFLRLRPMSSFETPLK